MEGLKSPNSLLSISDITEVDDLIDCKPLSIDETLGKWIESKKSSPALLNSPLVSKEKLEYEKLQLHEIDSEINEKFFLALDSIPIQILSKLPGFDSRVYQQLKIFRQSIKARIRRNRRKLLNLDQTEQPEDNDSLINSVALNKDSTTNCILKSNQELNLDCLRNITNNEDHIVMPVVDLRKPQQNRKSCFQWKKPMNLSFTLPSLQEPESLRNVTTQIENLPSSYITSNVKNIINSNRFHSFEYKKNELDLEEIIKVDAGRIFSSNSIMWNDSPEDDCKQASQTNDVLLQKSDVKDLKNTVSEIRFIGDIKNDGASGIFNNLDFAHCREMLNKFRMNFGLHQFRPNQLAAINAVILGHDCFVLMPTGGGKSLCYQLPALLSTGITIVISPLRSLIFDQTQKLLSLDIPTMYLTADLNDASVREVYRKMLEAEPELKLLYVTPEKIMQSDKFSSSLQTLYQRGKLARFVIDEVHCVSQWGHDFRPDYKKLSMLKKRFPGVQIIALTATATERVRGDILHQLHISSPKWFISSFNRPNLRYTVIQKKTKSSSQQIVDIIKSRFQNECGIVYCISRKDCENQAQILCNNGINALSYHAGLPDKVRIQRQSEWTSEKVNVVCATIAFGMGIDKPNVRYVLHETMPKSIEGYYQESGRAGRDGEPADSIVLYSYGDVYRWRFLLEQSGQGNPEALKTHLDNLYKIAHFCDNLADCRRVLQLNYFGEKFERENCIADTLTMCDNCKTHDQFVNLDVTEHAKALVQLIQDLERVRKNNVTILQVVDIYKGSDISSISYKLGHSFREWYGQGKTLTKNEIERLLHNLVVEGYLCENLQPNNGIVCAYVATGRLANELLCNNNVQITLQKKSEPQKTVSKISTQQMSAATNVKIKNLEQRCYVELLENVTGISSALNVSVNSIMNMMALRTMSQQLPCNEEEMLKIPHVTQANFEKYGQALLNVTQKYAKEKKGLLEEEEQKRSSDAVFEFDDSDTDSDWKDLSKKSQNVHKRYKCRSNAESKRFKSNNNSSAPSSTITSKVSVIKSASNDMNGKTSNSININTSENNLNTTSNSCRKNSYIPKRNKTLNFTKGSKSFAGKGKNTSIVGKGPGLCEFTKKYLIKKP